MNLPQTLAQLTLPPRRLLRRWLAGFRVARANPGCFLDYPIQWDFDDVTAIRLEPGVCIGAFSEVVVRKLSAHSKVAGALTMGAGSVIGVHANIRAEGGVVTIGRKCLMAQNVALVAANHAVSLAAPYMDLPIDERRTGVVIEDNVWIGANVVVLPGCVIGRNAVIGAGSVVTHDVPPAEVWAGVPARRLRSVA
jgi:acetyltransferase-like isoleucine patch superfamily enzyme